MADKDLLLIFQCLKLLVRQAYVGWEANSTVGKIAFQLDERIRALTVIERYTNNAR